MGKNPNTRGSSAYARRGKAMHNNTPNTTVILCRNWYIAASWTVPCNGTFLERNGLLSFILNEFSPFYWRKSIAKPLPQARFAPLYRQVTQ